MAQRPDEPKPAHKRERDRGHDECRISRRAEQQVEQHEDDSQGHWHDQPHPPQSIHFTG